MKLKVKKRDVPLTFVGTYTRQETPVLTLRAMDGLKANDLISDRFRSWDKLLRLSEEEVEKYYQDEIGAAYLFNYVIRRYLEEVIDNHSTLYSFNSVESTVIDCLESGHYLSFCPKGVIYRVLGDSKDPDYKITNLMIHGLSKLLEDNIILSYSQDLSHPKAINHWSIFLT